MANPDVKRGLVPTRMASGSVYNGSCNEYHVPTANADALFQGDPVTITGDADLKGVASVGLSAAAGPITGVIVGFRPTPTRDNDGYLKAATEGYVLVADDIGLECEIQANAAITSADVGQNAALDIAAGDPFYRRSNVQLDQGTLGAGDTLPLQLVGVVQREDNDAYDAGGNTKVRVRLNNSNARAGV